MSDAVLAKAYAVAVHAAASSAVSGEEEAQLDRQDTLTVFLDRVCAGGLLPGSDFPAPTAEERAVPR